MDQIQPFLNDALDFAHEGFRGVNVTLGLLIAVVAAFMMGSYGPRSIFVTSLGAAVVHLIAERLVPAIAGTGKFLLPDIMAAGYWRHAGTLFVGYILVISIFYFLKKIVVRGGH